MLLRAAAVYIVRIASGLGGLATLLIVGRLYSTSGLSELALFLLFFNLLSVYLAWGNNIRVVDQLNKCPNPDSLGVALVQIILNFLIVSPLAYWVLSEFGLWNHGLLGALPIAFATVVSSSFIARGFSIKAVVIHEAVRSFVPLLLIILAIQLNSTLDFQSLIGAAYLGLFLITPVIFKISFRSIDHLQRCVRVAIASWFSDQLRCFPIVLPQILFVVVAQADRLVIELLGTKADLAAYFAAQTVLSLLITAIQAFIAVFTPKISAVAFHNAGSIKGESKKIFFSSMVVTILTIPASAIYFKLIDVDFSLAMRIFALLAGSVLVALVFGVGFQALQFFHSKKPYLVITIACIVLQYFTIFIFFDSLNVFAAALGFGLYTITTSFISWRFWSRQRVAVSPLW